MPRGIVLIQPMHTSDILASLRARQNQMVEMLASFVTAESPSADTLLTEGCARIVSQACKDLIGKHPQSLVVQGTTHLLLEFGSPRVLLLGHLDTVWPQGTIERWPFTVDGDRATGPGVFDMKAGLVQCLFALTLLDDLDGIALLVTSDEEPGSHTSRELIEQTARGCVATLVFEPSAEGALKTERKGVSLYELEVTGRASHAGLEPEKGINAAVEMAHQILELERLSNPTLGTTVTPTRASAGTAINVVPSRADIAVDVRVFTSEEQTRVHEAIYGLTPVVDGTSINASGGPNRPPLPASSSKSLFARASALAENLGIAPLRQASVGGASDGNFTAALGVPTLDGLGAVGDGAHAEGEYVEIGAMAERAALAALLVKDLLAITIGTP
ncbi:MAG: M20 family metallopeptidase [Actinomycetota bacterium]